MTPKLVPYVDVTFEVVDTRGSPCRYSAKLRVAGAKAWIRAHLTQVSGARVVEGKPAGMGLGPQKTSRQLPLFG